MIGYILDGMTDKGYIAEERGMWPALSFEYRPFTQAELIELEIGMGIARAQGPLAERKYVAEKLAQHMCGWDLKTHLGQPAPYKTGDDLMHMRNGQFIRFFRIVTGDKPGDISPHAPAPQVAERVDMEAQALASDRTLREVVDQAQAKNS
jgi:hypothetical protein